MGLPEYAEVLRRRWRSVLILCLLGAVVAVGASVLGATRSASTTLIIGTAGVDGGATGGELASQRLATYAELATSPRIASAVAGDLGRGDAAEVRRDLSAQAQPDSLLLVITARDAVPELATAKATSAAEQVLALVDEVSPGGPGLTVAQPAALAPPVGLLGTVSSALLGAALGLAAGVVLALLRDGTDRRVSGAPASVGPGDGAGGRGSAGSSVPERSPGSAGSVVLAGLAVSSKGLHRHVAAMPREGSVAEGFRRLRASLLADGSTRRTVLVTSSQSGEGASEVARGLAVVLARGGLQVALVDAHLRAGARGDERSAADQAPPHGLSAVLRGQVSPESSLVNGGEPGLAVLPRGAASPDAGELLTSPHMAKLLASLHGSADVVLVDVPAVLPFADAAALTSAVGAEAVLVVRSGVTRERDAEAALEELSRAQPTRLGVVVLTGPVGRRG